MLTQPPLTSSVVKATASKVFSSAPCTLTWRDRKLFVRAASLEESLDLEALQDSDRLVECLRRSPVDLVKLDSTLDTQSLTLWVYACEKAKKACFVDLSKNTQEHDPETKRNLSLKLSSQLLGSVALILTSPLIGVQLILSYLKISHLSLGSLRSTDSRGKVLGLIQFQSTPKITREISLIEKIYCSIPNLINIARGEILLFERAIPLL